MMDLGLSLYTEHFKPGFNDQTVGVYAHWDGGATAGLVRNSLRRMSAYGGWTWETPDRRWAFTAGLISGYPVAPVLPFAAPSFRQPLGGQWAMRLTLLPGYKAPPALHFSLEHPL